MLTDWLKKYRNEIIVGVLLFLFSLLRDFFRKPD